MNASTQLATLKSLSPTPNSRLPTPDSQLPTPDFQYKSIREISAVITFHATHDQLAKYYPIMGS
ncbi:MAG TPA: hypothetical protein DCE56_19455 [Cyanobacteria bacterium UBA8553]|nr:hypothetical protein [Cyanobacteria bacterium UBA8553]